MNLSKGQQINLSKAEESPIFKIGASWGKVKSGGMFGFGEGSQEVDLDLCTFALKGNNTLVSECSFRDKHVPGMTSSGDDMGGGGSGDNETITIDTSKLRREVDNVVVIINSYSGQSFDKLPYAKVRVYTGAGELCQYTMDHDDSFKGAKTFIIGRFLKTAGGWEFQAIGETRKYNRINQFIAEVERA